MIPQSVIKLSLQIIIKWRLILHFNFKVTWFSTEPGMLIRFYKSDLLEKYKLLTLKEIMSTGANLGKKHCLALAKKLPHAFITTGYGISQFDLKVSH